MKSIFFYFEPGNSHMSADSFHHGVAQEILKKRKVYDFQDLKDCVQKTFSGRTILHEMTYGYPRLAR